MPFITIADAQLAWGDLPLLDRAQMQLDAGERVGLIGRNGTGKSSLMHVLAGRDKLDDGILTRQDGLVSVYLEQEPNLPEAATLRESLLARGRFKDIADEREKWAAIARLDEYLHRLRTASEQNPQAASGGEKKKAALALALSLKPDFLLLDEPTNHLDVETIEILEGILTQEYRSNRSLIVVTHDRAFLDTVCTRILELDRGILRSYPGNFAAYETRKTKNLMLKPLPTGVLTSSGHRRKFGFARVSKHAAPAMKAVCAVWKPCVANAPLAASVWDACP